MPRDYDSVYKAFYERLFQKWNIPIETQVEVSRRARSIDAVIRCDMEHIQRLKGTAFRFFKRINSLELKSPGDALSLADYMNIVSRAYGLLSKQKKEAEQLPTNATITIVCSVRPNKILDDLNSELCFLPESESGFYLSKKEIERRIVVSTELEVIEKNYPLLVLAKGKKLLEFFEEVVKNDLMEYAEILLEVGIYIDPETIIEGVRRMAERHQELTPSLKRALDRWFEDYPQHIDEMESIQRVIEAEKRNASIQAKQESLCLLLENKFGKLPQELVSILEDLSDVDELTRLYKQALQARTLAEIGLQRRT